MPTPILADALDLDEWSKRRDSQAQLPRLVRQLIQATSDSIEQMAFPADEGIQLGGWDGRLTATIGSAFIPAGDSRWEFGTSDRTKSKADADYGKRSSNPDDVNPLDAVFVFVTSRRWAGKAAWLSARKQEGIWQDVRAYDADDLEQWLELAPMVHRWISREIGKVPTGLEDLSHYWQEWSRATNPPLPPELITAGRQNEREALYNSLRGQPDVIGIQAESVDEASAFVAAAIYQLPDWEQTLLLSRGAIIHSAADWRQMAVSQTPLVLVAMFPEREIVAQAPGIGHHVIVPLRRRDNLTSGTIVLPRLRRSEVRESLLMLGISHNRADELAKLARRSLAAFRRRLAAVPGSLLPTWARTSVMGPLVVALLIGSWDETNSNDCKIVSELAGMPYPAVRMDLAQLAGEPDPPLHQVGSVWSFTSKDDGWAFRGQLISSAELELFEKITLRVLGEVDPRLELPADQRWMSALMGVSPIYSVLLREGIADTLAIMSAEEDIASQFNEGMLRAISKRITRTLLNAAGNNWQAWASLSHILGYLAEVDSDTFLDAISTRLSNEDPLVVQLFANRANSSGSGFQTRLLWSLETLAWSPDYLAPAALALAALVRLDPEPNVKNGNRPSSSLREIFLSWHPQTAATLDHRLNVIDLMRTHEPQVAWNLLCQLVPHSNDVGRSTSMPRRRDWVPDPMPSVTLAEIYKATEEIVNRLLVDVGTNRRRWQDLLEKIDILPPTSFHQVVEALNSLNLNQWTADENAILWNDLCDLFHKHRAFPDAEWVLDNERLDELERATKHFEPTDLVLRCARLFSDRRVLPLASFQNDWRARDAALAGARRTAVESVYASGGIECILALCRAATRAFDVGLALGGSTVGEEHDDEWLTAGLGSLDETRRLFTYGFVQGRFWSKGDEWIEERMRRVHRSAWSPHQIAEFFLCLPGGAQTWDRVDHLEEDTRRLYWAEALPCLHLTPAECQRSATEWLRYKRPHYALLTIGFNTRESTSPVPYTLILEALEMAIVTPAPARLDRQEYRHFVSEFLDLLITIPEIDSSRLANIEWLYMDFLENYRLPQLLHRELARSPDFMIETLKYVYRADNEEAHQQSEADSVLARLGYELLDNWRVVPGHRVDGTIDESALSEWVNQVRGKAQSVGRLSVADIHIGHVLAFSPIGTDGDWPDLAIRNLVEHLKSNDIEDGICIQIHNNRGVTMRGDSDGGEQERHLSERYYGFALRLSHSWPRTAALLRRIGESYSEDGKREDLNAELRQDL